MVILISTPQAHAPASPRHPRPSPREEASPSRGTPPALRNYPDLGARKTERKKRAILYCMHDLLNCAPFFSNPSPRARTPRLFLTPLLTSFFLSPQHSSPPPVSLQEYRTFISLTIPWRFRKTWPWVFAVELGCAGGGTFPCLFKPIVFGLFNKYT